MPEITRPRTIALAIVLAVVLAPARTFAQIVVSGGSGQVLQAGPDFVYSQDFNGLGSTSGSWTNNATLPGWYAARATAPTTIANLVASNGSSGTGNLYNYGSTGSADRALGSLRGGSTGNLAYGAVFENQTGLPLIVNVSYTGEHWRNGGNHDQTLHFTFKTSSSAITNFDSSAETAQGFLAPGLLDFNTPTWQSGQFALDGNLPVNQSALNGTLPLTVNPGDYLALRWWDPDDPGREHGMAVDDMQVTFTPVPEPVGLLAWAGLGLALCGLAFRRCVQM